MRRVFEGPRIALLLLPLVVVNLVAPHGGAAQEEYRLGGGAAVYNLAGAVEIVPGSGGAVVVQVMRGGSDAQRLDLSVQDVDGREALVIRYPSENVVYPVLGRGSTVRMRVREDGTFFGDGGSSSNHEVEISGSGSGMEAWADLRISVPAGSDFSLFLATGETHARDVEGDILIDTGSGPVFTRGGRGELDIDTGSGEISVEGFAGDLMVDTGSGEVELTDVRGGEVMVDTGSGSVTGTGVSATSLGVDTGSGGIRLRGISAPEVSLDTGSGGVELELLSDVDQLEIDTGSGGVTVWVPGTVGAEVELDTGSGGIEVDLPLEVRRARRDHVTGVLGDGRGTIVIDTGSGEIRIIAG